ncbi:MAG: hypothetical protein E7606_03435 [Ruminococcaceae bacterium]|nr:hypothetical protein [Oscillospiraceae bacterium]
MTDYEIYVFILCLIVFLLLTTLSIVCLNIITRLSLRLIRGGLEDEKIIKEHEKKQKHKKRIKVAKIADFVFSGVICLLFLTMLAGSLVIQSTENTCCGNIPTYRVVLTGSMAEKHEKNRYLWENDLNNHLQTFDLIRTEKLPAEDELELYDIVVYEVDNILLVHRIVGIEEPNETHPNARHFLLQGDAVEAPDRFPVLYEQMRAIYSGERIPFIGSFILFMQSPAGWLCTLLIVASIIASPILDRILQKARDERYALISTKKDDEEEQSND